MAILFKRLKQGMGNASKDGNTPMPRKKAFHQNRRVIGGLRGLRIEYMPRNQKVMFMAKMQGEKDKYITKLRFEELTGKATEGVRPKAIKVKTGKGEVLYIDKPNINKNPVDVSCTCLDFRFSFEHQLFTKGKHLMNKWTDDERANRKATTFTRYTRKTPPGTRPASPKNPNEIGRDFKNPDNILGYCKHLHSLMRFLVDRDLIDGSY